MANIDVLKTNLSDIANAIRSKTGKTAELTMAEMPTEIRNIKTDTIPSNYGRITWDGYTLTVD